MAPTKLSQDKMLPEMPGSCWSPAGLMLSRWEQADNAFDEFKHLLLGFIAVATINIALAPLALWRQSDHRGHHPPAADQEQLFKGVLDWIIGSNLFGGQAKPSAIALGSRLIIAANGIAQTLDQGVKQKSLAAVVGHVRDRYATGSRPTRAKQPSAPRSTKAAGSGAGVGRV